MHSFLNFRESSSSCLSITLLLSLLPLCSGASANAALNPCEPLPARLEGSASGATGSAVGPVPFGIVGGAAAGLASVVWTEGLFGSSVEGEDMQAPMLGVLTCPSAVRGFSRAGLAVCWLSQEVDAADDHVVARRLKVVYPRCTGVCEVSQNCVMGMTKRGQQRCERRKHAKGN